MTNQERAEKIYRLLLKPETSLEYADPTDFIVAQLEEVQREVIQDRDAWKSRAADLAKALQRVWDEGGDDFPAMWQEVKEALAAYKEDLKR